MKVINRLEPFILPIELGTNPSPVMVIVFVPTPTLLDFGLIKLITGFGLSTGTLFIFDAGSL